METNDPFWQELQRIADQNRRYERILFALTLLSGASAIVTLFYSILFL